MSTPRTAKDAKRGDRVWWVKPETGKLNDFAIIEFSRESIPLIYVRGSTVFLRPEDFGTRWGFLSENEAVIGGQIVKPNDTGTGWLIDIYSIQTQNILDESASFVNCCNHFKMNDGDMQAIQDHVRKHSAPAHPVPKKRTAADAKNGDKVWVCCVDGCIDAEISEVHGNYVVISVWPHGFGAFGVDWGFPEDRPDAPKEPAPITHAAPIGEKPAPTQADEDRAMLARKGAQWIRVHRPDVWNRLRDATMDAVRREHEKLNQPGVLTGKVPRFK